MSFQHLTAPGRAVIAHLHSQGESQAEIARQLGRSPSTICRELRRGRLGEMRTYETSCAQDLARARRAEANGYRAGLRDKRVLKVVKEGMRRRWSPELLVGRLRALGSGLKPCAMTIHRYLKRDREKGGKLELGLPRRGKGRRPNGSCCGRRRPKPGRRTLDERPAGATNRSRHGHLEGDTIEGAGKSSYIVSLVDRKSRFTLLAKAENKTKDVVGRVLGEMLARLSTALHRTLTLDNGTEFNGYEDVEVASGVQMG